MFRLGLSTARICVALLAMMRSCSSLVPSRPHRHSWQCKYCEIVYQTPAMRFGELRQQSLPSIAQHYNKPQYMSVNEHPDSCEELIDSNINSGITFDDEKNRYAVKESQSSTHEVQEGCSVELWLDLRGTLISPKSAVEYLNFELQREMEHDVEQNNAERQHLHEIDRVLVSAESFDELIHTVPSKRNIDVILVDRNSGSERTSLRKRAQKMQEDGHSDGIMIDSEKFGDVFELDAINTNPITALECVFEGMWAVLDHPSIPSSTECDESQVVSAIQSFVELLHSSSNLALSPISSSKKDELLVHARNESFSTKRKYKGGGGVSLVCKTKAELLRFGATLRMLNCDEGDTTSMHNSGILLVACKEVKNDRHLCPPQSDQSISTAIVIPFDIQMWRAALFLFPR